jgi:hypothetical protein
VSMEHSVSVSLNFGVHPIRTTLSLQAMHSKMSPDRYAWGSSAARKRASPGFSFRQFSRYGEKTCRANRHSMR